MKNDNQIHGGGQPPVTFTIDGVEFTTDNRRQSASQLLMLAGVDPATHDLARVVGKDIEHRFADDEDVQITPGARYVTFFSGPAQVASS